MDRTQDILDNKPKHDIPFTNKELGEGGVIARKAHHHCVSEETKCILNHMICLCNNNAQKRKVEQYCTIDEQIMNRFRCRRQKQKTMTKLLRGVLSEGQG